MGIVIESFVWEPNRSVYLFIFFSCFFSIILFPYFSKITTSYNPLSSFNNGPSSSHVRIQRTFLLLYSLASVTEGLWLVFGEFELVHYGYSREQMTLSLCVGHIVAFLFGTFFGMLSDIIGHKKVCLLFWILHLFIGIWKRTTPNTNIWALSSIGLSLATSIFLVSFETWMVVEHEKLGYKKDTLSGMFWLMTFFESVSFIGSQVLANTLIDENVKESVVFPSIASVFLAMIGFFCTIRRAEPQQTVTLKDYRVSSLYICGDKRIWLLTFAQACFQFSLTIFWILWAPTLVADGRGLHLGLVYPCLMGAKMLGSTIFPWLISSGPSPLQTEDYLIYVFGIMGLVLSIAAYDYQEIGFLLLLFCTFHACAGLILPLLARLRSIYIPNELRAGMMSMSLAPANAAAVFFLLLGGYYQNMENSVIMAFSALGLFMSAGCMYMLKRWEKQLNQETHRL